MGASLMARLRELVEESSRLKKIYAEERLRPRLSRRQWKKVVRPLRIYKTQDMAYADVFDCIEAFTIERVVTVTWAASVLRPMKVPHFEAGKCLWVGAAHIGRLHVSEDNGRTASRARLLRQYR